MTRPLSDDERAELRMGEIMEGLIKSPGWQAYVKLLESHMDQMQRDALAPFKQVQQLKAQSGITYHAEDHMLEQESHKGALIGLRLARTLPENIMRVSKDIRRDITEGRLDDNEEETE